MPKVEIDLAAIQQMQNQITDLKDKISEVMKEKTELRIKEAQYEDRAGETLMLVFNKIFEDLGFELDHPRKIENQYRNVVAHYKQFGTIEDVDVVIGADISSKFKEAYLRIGVLTPK